MSASRGFDGMDFPMWVLPVSALLEMKGPAKHHQELLKSGLLVRWCPGMSGGSMASPIISGIERCISSDLPHSAIPPIPVPRASAHR